MEDYIQNLFAERIGGSSFGKGTVLYKFEKISGRDALRKNRIPKRRLSIWVSANRTGWRIRRS